MKHPIIHQQAFTFIEMVLAMSIMAVVMAWGFPEYREFKSNQLITQSVNRFAAVILFARSQSIIRSEHIIVCPATEQLVCLQDGQWHEGLMVFADLDRDRIFNNDDVMLLTEGGMGEGITARSSRFRNRIRFDQTGFSPGTNVTVRFCDQRGVTSGKAIVINNVGRPRLSNHTQRCE